jgi:hypothetical protein
MTARWRRRSDVTERRLGASLFLARSGAGAVQRLNATGAALWRLLAEPLAIAEAVEAFGTAFPRQPRARLRAEIEDLVAALVASDLVEAA